MKNGEKRFVRVREMENIFDRYIMHKWNIEKFISLDTQTTKPRICGRIRKFGMEENNIIDLFFIFPKRHKHIGIGTTSYSDKSIYSGLQSKVICEGVEND